MTDHDQLYVRYRGRVTGPFSTGELKQMASRGQLSRLHQVSSDQVNWQRGDHVPGLFEAPRRRAPVAVQTVEPAAEASPGAIELSPQLPDQPAAAARQWYYSMDNEKIGPLAEPLLRQMVHDKALPAQTMVWREGLTQWQQLAHSELVDRPQPTEGEKAGKEGATGEAADLSRQSASAGIVLAAAVLTCLHVPLVHESQTMWWWHIADSTTSQLAAGLLIICALTTGGAAILLNGAARAIAYLSVSAVSLLLMIAMLLQAANGESLMSVLLLCAAFGLIATTRARLRTGPQSGLRVPQGLLGGSLSALAGIATIIFVFRATDMADADLDIGVDGAMGMILVGSGLACLLAAGISALCAFGRAAGEGLNRAIIRLGWAGPAMCMIGTVLLFGAVGLRALAFFDAPQSALPQLYLLVARLCIIALSPFILLEWGLLELLCNTLKRPSAAGKEAA